MYVTEIILWLVAYGLLLIFSAIAINGLHITTRGEMETLPDGSTARFNDMIFYKFLQLVSKEKKKKRIYYQAEQLQKLTRTMLKKMPLPPPDSIENAYLRYNNGRGQDAVRLWQSTTIEYMDEQEIKLDAEYDAIELYGRVMFYKEYPVFYLPKYVRKPLLECIKCMASIWGSLIYWPIMLSLFGYHPYEFAIWIPFCFSLSWLNTFFYHKAS